MPQRASLAFYGRLPFATMASGECDYVLLRDSVKTRDDREMMRKYEVRNPVALWEGRRASDRDERFRLFRRDR